MINEQTNQSLFVSLVIIMQAQRKKENYFFSIVVCNGTKKVYLLFIWTFNLNFVRDRLIVYTHFVLNDI
jgi:hypothetical protein